MFNLSKLVITPVLIGAIFHVFSSELNELDNWVMGHLKNSDELLCQFQNGHDYYFVAKHGGKLKTGHRIDVTGQNGKSKSFIIRWGFKDKDDQYVGLPVKPSVEVQRLFYKEDRAYVEEIAIYTVDSTAANEGVRVEVGIEKYNKISSVPESDGLGESSINDFVVCEGINGVAH